MWALAIWDRRNRQLFLARDRLGIKPLYYVQLGRRFLFASEFKAVLAYQGFQPTADLLGIHEYLALRYSPGPGGMLQQLRKLPAGHYATLVDGRLRTVRFWEPALTAGPWPLRDEEYVEGFAERFELSVRRRLMSEVPLGAYLSGGVDSGVIVAAMASLSESPVRTFTVGFDYEHDELRAAAETARALGCEHTEIACRPADVGLLPSIVWHLDEPIGDPIVIPMYQLAREAKRQVTVILAGEGADETLGGYLFHRAILGGQHIARLPRAVRRFLLEPLLAATPAALFNLAFDYPATLQDRGKQKIVDFAQLLDPDHPEAVYRHLISLFDPRDTAGMYTRDFADAVRRSEGGMAGSPPVDPGVPLLNRLLHLQFPHWLPDDILLKQDKMSMANGIEARVPFLDHELVEYTLQLPPHLKIHRGGTKVILRRYAERLLPRQAARRRKMPFYVPLSGFFGEPAFREMVEDTLAPRVVRERGLFQPAAIERLRGQVARGDFVHAKQVFSLVMLELWFRMVFNRSGSRA
jgi:asparagine synthase (glutamine-hydrolysing)